MSDEDKRDRERALRERIVSLIRANSQATQKPIPSSELQQLKSAASRLDQILKAAGEAEKQALRAAAVRLDQLLIEIGKRKSR
jgi:hypothetical protein